MSFLIKTVRGLTFHENQIAEAELFCNLPAPKGSPADMTEQREVAARLAFYFEKVKKNKEKAIFYLAKATATSIQEGFEYSIDDFFTFYTIPRIFLGALNRVTSIFKFVFLPIWFPLLGLNYLIQGPLAYARGDSERGYYFSAWFVFNAVGSLGLMAALLGVSLGAAAPVILLTGTGAGIYGMIYDIHFSVAKYFNALKTHDQLQNILRDDEVAHHHFIEVVKKDKRKTQLDYEENIGVGVLMFIGVSLYVLSAFIPPVFIGLSIFGGAIALAAATILMGQLVHSSWTDNTGFLKVCVRDPIRRWLKWDGPSAPVPSPVPDVNLETTAVFLTRIQEDIILNPGSFSDKLSKLDDKGIKKIKEIFNFNNRNSAWKKQLELWLKFENEKWEGIKSGFYYCSFEDAIVHAMKAIPVPKVPKPNFINQGSTAEMVTELGIPAAQGVNYDHEAANTEFVNFQNDARNNNPEPQNLAIASSTNMMRRNV